MAIRIKRLRINHIVLRTFLKIVPMLHWYEVVDGLFGWRESEAAIVALYYVALFPLSLSSILSLSLSLWLECSRASLLYFIREDNEGIGFWRNMPCVTSLKFFLKWCFCGEKKPNGFFSFFFFFFLEIKHNTVYVYAILLYNKHSPFFLNLRRGEIKFPIII